MGPDLAKSPEINKCGLSPMKTVAKIVQLHKQRARMRDADQPGTAPWTGSGNSRDGSG